MSPRISSLSMNDTATGSSARTYAALDDDRAYYEESERVYASWFASVYDAVSFPLRRVRTRVARLAGIAPGMRVIDVATGTGAQARAFAKAGAVVVGVDLSTRMLAIARRKTRDLSVTYVHADATALPAPDASVDAGCVSFALHEMPPGIRDRTLAELVRVTRPGGTIVVVDFALPRSRIWRGLVVRAISLFESEYYAGFIRSDLRALLERAGVTVRDTQVALLGIARIVIGERRSES